MSTTINLGVSPENIPTELKELPRWAAWGKDGLKRPVGTHGHWISYKDPQNLVTFDKIREAQPDLGVGFAILEDDPFLLIDIDGCVEEPFNSKTKKQWVSGFRPFLTHCVPFEWSQSGMGLHIVPRVPSDYRLPTWWENISFGDHEGIEVYDGPKFAIVTGNPIPDDGDFRCHCDPDVVEEMSPGVIDQWLREITDRFGAPPQSQQPPGPPGAGPGICRPREEVVALASTDDFQDVYDAAFQLEPDDFPLRSEWMKQRPDGTESWNPSYRASQSKTSLAYFPNARLFHDRMHERPFSPLQLFAAEHGIISNPWDLLAGEAFHEAVIAAREHGAPIPEYDGKPENLEDYCIWLPGVPDNQWVDDRHLREEEPEDSPRNIDGVRNRTSKALIQCLERPGTPTLVEVLPGGGKSYGIIYAAARTRQPLVYLTSRGRKERYNKATEWCETHGLTSHILPSFTEDCPTARGDHGEEWQRKVMDLYNAGALGEDIHRDFAHHFDAKLPCQADGKCPYSEAWNFDIGEYDILIGHYHHAHLGHRLVRGRVVAIDEFPSEYEFEFKPGLLRRSVNAYLQSRHGAPFDDLTELLESRRNPDIRQAALEWFHDNPARIKPDPSQAFRGGHRMGPVATFALLACADLGGDLGNGMERCDLPDHLREYATVAVFSREAQTLHIITPPPLESARGVVALDGTPNRRMWEMVLGTPLRRVAILNSDEDKAAYVEHALGLTLIQTTDKVKPYSGGGNVNSEEDLAILRKIRARHPREDVALISSRRALQQYESENSGLDELVDIQGHYGNLKGSNEYLDTPVGIISGSTHFGDDFVKRWAAYLREGVEANRDYESQTGLGMDLSYGPVGDRILRHMREDEVLQAVLRFGRGAVPATVYVNTAAVPSWLPFAGTAQVTKVSSGERMTLDAISELLREEDIFTTRDLVQHPDIEIGERQISRHLKRFVEEGLIEFEIERGRRIYRPLVSFGEIGSDPIRVELSPQREHADTSP